MFEPQTHFSLSKLNTFDCYLPTLWLEGLQAFILELSFEVHVCGRMKTRLGDFINKHLACHRNKTPMP